VPVRAEGPGPCGKWQRRFPSLVPSVCHPDEQVTGHGQDLLLANRRPPIVWVSTALGLRSLSGLVYPPIGRRYWHGRGTGGSIRHRALAPDRGPSFPNILRLARSRHLNLAVSLGRGSLAFSRCTDTARLRPAPTCNPMPGHHSPFHSFHRSQQFRMTPILSELASLGDYPIGSPQRPCWTRQGKQQRYD
jgi:hypothetical protein